LRHGHRLARRQHDRDQDAGSSVIG
jgi:hypothetical protein